MEVREIRVTAGRTFNHPYEQFSNLRPAVVMIATLAPGEDPVKATKELQAKAEGVVEDHKRAMLESLRELHVLSRTAQEVHTLERELQRAQGRLEQIRKQHPDLKGLPLLAGAESQEDEWDGRP